LFTLQIGAVRVPRALQLMVALVIALLLVVAATLPTTSEEHNRWMRMLMEQRA
jgi:hypothetical protein